MFKKLIINFRKMSDVSLKMMYYGTQLSLGVLIIGIWAFGYNKYTFAGNYFNAEICIEIVRSAFSLFVQFIIGGLIFDCVSAKRR